MAMWLRISGGWIKVNKSAVDILSQLGKISPDSCIEFEFSYDPGDITLHMLIKENDDTTEQEIIDLTACFDYRFGQAVAKRIEKILRSSLAENLKLNMIVPADKEYGIWIMRDTDSRRITFRVWRDVQNVFF